MQGRAIPLLVLLSGAALSLCLCLGCTSEQWVKEYVKGETTGLQETLDRYTADRGKRQEESEKKQIALEEEITEMRASLEAMDKKLAEWNNFIGRLKEEAERSKEPLSEEIKITSPQSEIEKKFAKLEEIETDLNRLKELKTLDYTTTEKEMTNLANQVNDAKRFFDMNVSAILKAQSLLKEFIIEEVRTLRLERQEYARELESIKGRLQAIEGAMGKKGASDNERRQ